MAGRILVVGNDAITALDIEEILTGHGYRVTTAVPMTSRAIRVALRISPDLVVLDVSGDSSGGVASARQVCERLRVPVVLLTGVLHAEIEQHAESAGPSCLNKPFWDHDLLRLVRKSLAGRPVNDPEDCEGIVEKEEGLCPL